MERFDTFAKYSTIANNDIKLFQHHRHFAAYVV